MAQTKKAVKQSAKVVKAAKVKKRDPLGMEIGERIARSRAAANLTTIASLHKRTIAVDPERKGISQPVLLGYESGEYKPGARELRLLCQALGISPTWLLFGQENATKEAAVGVPVPLTFGKTLELNDEQKRGALVGMLFGYFTKQERDAWIAVIELYLRAKLGDAPFELRQAALVTVTDMLVSPGLGEDIIKLFESVLTPEQMQALGEKLDSLAKPKFAEINQAAAKARP